MDRQTHKHTNTHTHIFQPDYRKFIVKSSYRSEICLQQIFLKVMNYLFSPKTFSVGVTVTELTLILLTWTIWRAPTNASKWRMGFNSAFKGLSKEPGCCGSLSEMYDTERSTTILRRTYQLCKLKKIVYLEYV
jgi:hypothetical protein